MITHCPHCQKPISEKTEPLISETRLRSFWGKVLKQPDGCWIFHGGSQVYGKFRLNGAERAAHHVSWLIHKGPIPDGLVIMHSCDVPRCVNPDHLSAGTQADNVQDMMRKGRHKSFPGSRNPIAKLDEEKVAHIRQSLASKTETIKSLAEKYGVTFQCVFRVARGRGWNLVGGEVLAKKSRVFTPEQILEIKSLPRIRGTVNRYAEKTGIHQSVICHIRNGKRHPNISK